MVSPYTQGNTGDGAGESAVSYDDIDYDAPFRTLRELGIDEEPRRAAFSTEDILGLKPACSLSRVLLRRSFLGPLSKALKRGLR